MDASDWDIIAKDYYKEVISPLKDSIENPLIEEIEKNSFEDKVVLDAGCGVGRLLPLLSKNFKEVHAKDYSKEMINQSIKNSGEFSNVNCFVGDLKKSYNEKEKYNVLISVNSILDPNVLNITKIFNVFHHSLKKGGTFYGVLPSMESYIYQGMLMLDKKMSHKKEQKEVVKKVKKALNEKNFDFTLGKIDFDGDVQKAFYRFEIIYRLKKAGFTNIQLGKVYYDWKEWREAGQTYYPKESPPWDWYVKCEKPI